MSIIQGNTIDRKGLADLSEREERRFVEEHPRSQELFEQAKANLLGGVPMNWMVRWVGAFPLFVAEAEGAHFTDVDGRRYLDLCLGDTGAMTGHAPPAAVEALRRQSARGNTFMLPTEDAIWVGRELSRRFGLPFWQTATTATDANRFAVRWARQITGRKKILVFNWCYHGSVDESLVTLAEGKTVPREGNIGPAVDPAETTKVIEFNDIQALEEALVPEDVACVLAEPVLTNIGIVHPRPGYHESLRELTRRTGTILIIDETHTICTGPGGYTAAYGLKPDMLTLGKPIASGVPAAVYGFSVEVAESVQKHTDVDNADVGGTGGTLAGNALATAAMRATLSSVLTEEAYSRMIPLAERFTAGVEGIIQAYRLPWHVTRLGCRAEYWFIQDPPKNGGEAAAAMDRQLDHFTHLASLNRGILLTPFHNMALICPATTEQDVDLHTEVFREIVELLVR
jgi:glutamate-1-semialdehyde 2,1-aminomutase